MSEKIYDDEEIIEEVGEVENDQEPTKEELQAEEVEAKEFEAWKFDVSQMEHNRKVGDTLGYFIMTACNHPVLTKEQELDLFNEYKETGDKSVRDTIVNHNMRLLLNLAMHCLTNATQTMDLVQEGSFGLLTAIEKFEPSMGFKFSTYATWWIKQAIIRSQSNGDLVRRPVHVVDKARYLRKIIEEKTQDLGREPTKEEVKIIAMKERKQFFYNEAVFENIYSYLFNKEIVSLNKNLTDDADATTLEEMIADEETDIRSADEKEDLLRAIREAVKQLKKPDQVRVLQMRFFYEEEETFKNGTWNGAPTLEQCAIQLSKEKGLQEPLARERIRQIEKAALQHLSKNESLMKIRHGLGLRGVVVASRKEGL